MRSSAALSLSAVAVLALGIGLSTLALAMLLAFSSLTSPGMRSMGYATIAEETGGGGSAPITWNTFESISHLPQQRVEFAAYSRGIATNLDRDGKSSSLTVAAVSRNFFSVFTTDLAAGRDFNPDAEGQQEQHVIVIGASLATKLFNSSEFALNRFLVLDGVPYRVIGVASPRFNGLFGNSVDAWVPPSSVLALEFPSQAKLAPQNLWKALPVFYGLAASHMQASFGMTQALSQSLPLHRAGKTSLHVSQGLTNDPLRDAKQRKWLRLGLLLGLIFTIISSLNYSLLLLARTPRYADEVLLKRALGASTGRLATELMIGPAITLGIAVLVASALWMAGLFWLSGISPFYEQLMRGSYGMALVALGIQVPVMCALTLLIALIPAIQLLRDNANPHSGYAITSPRRSGLFLQTLVTSQIALCVGTCILAAMVIAAVVSTESVGLGFDPSHRTVLSIGPTSDTISFITGHDRSFPPVSVTRGLIEQALTLPGAQAAAVAEAAPFDDSHDKTIQIERLDGTVPAPLTVDDIVVSPGYFRAIGTRVLLGSEFSWADLEGDTSGVITNESLARELWPNASPVGRSLRLIFPALSGIPSSTSVATVIGLAPDIHFSGLAETPEPTIFRSIKGTALIDSLLIVEGTEPAAALRKVSQQQLNERVPSLGVQSVYSIAERAQQSLWQIEKRAYFALAGALTMALIAYIGLYGTLIFYVNTRRRELAVRACLGANPWTIRKIILLRAARCAVLAAIISLPLWPILAQLSSSDYLGQVSWSTPRAILLSLACIAIAIVVSLIPARSAVRTSPAEVLKEL